VGSSPVGVKRKIIKLEFVASRAAKHVVLRRKSRLVGSESGCVRVKRHVCPQTGVSVR
jgi:hypothetical protein